MLQPLIVETPESVFVGVEKAAPSVAALAEEPMCSAGMGAWLARAKGETANAVPGEFYAFRVEPSIEPRMRFWLAEVGVNDPFLNVFPIGTYAVVAQLVVDVRAKLDAGFDSWLVASDRAF